MEFHRRIKEKKEKEIINIRQIKPKVRIVENQSQYKIYNIKQYPTKKLFLSEKDYIKRDINQVLEGNDLYFQKEIPLKKTYSQSIMVNPINKVEYLNLNNSSQTMGTNSFLVNQNSDKYNSLIMIDSMNNMNNFNDLEANSDKERDSSYKIRYHRAKRYSPFYKNTFENNKIYNRLYEQEQEQEQDLDTNKMRTFNNNIENNDINDLNEINQVNNNNTQINNNNMIEKQFLYSSDDGQESPKYKEINNNINYNRKLVRKYTDIYDPRKNKKGILLPKAKMTFSLSSSPLSFEKRRNFSKNSKLSDLIMNKKISPENFRLQTNDDFYSGSEDKTTWQNDTRKREKKTFNRRSFEKYQQNKTLIRLNKSPQERFKNITLAMISSKGKNTEDRPILTNMRFERGGVVDLAQSDRKKNKYKYLIKKIKRPKLDELIHNNPKYREKAAKLIKEWWRAIKEYRKKRNESAILIQSYFRGRFVRKYLYDVIYMNYIYFGFCKKIEKFIKKKYGPFFLNAIYDKFIRRKNALKKIVEENNRKIIKYYLKKWNLIHKKFNKKNLSLLYMLRIRAIRESKLFNLKRVFSKWNYISIIKKERTDYNKNKYLMREKNIIKEYVDEEIEKEINKIEKNDINNKDYSNNDEINKIKALFKIINGSDKFMKKKAMEMTGDKIKEYLGNVIKKNKLGISSKDEIIKIKMELFIKKLKPIICSNKELYDLFLKLISLKIKRMKLRKKYRNKGEENKDNNDKDYIYSKEYKKIKKEKIEEYDIMDSEEEENSEESNDIEKNDNKNKSDKKIKENKLEHLKKYYILRNMIRIKKIADNRNMRKYFDIWKNGKNKKYDENYTKKLIKIQSNTRKIISKNKLEKLKNLNIILKRNINRQSDYINSILLFKLRKWNSYTKQIACINQIELIQRTFRKYILNKNMNKLKTFFLNAYKKYILTNLGKISKIRMLNSIFKNIAKNRIGFILNRILKNRRISELLLNIIDKNENIYNNDLKMYYLNKWNNRKNVIKYKDNKRMKRLLMKIFNKKDNIKKILKLYLLSWKRNHNLLLMNDCAIIIQRNWKRKKISDIKNERMKENIIFIKKINDKINKIKKKYYFEFFEKIKKLNRNYILSKFENSFSDKKINILKDVMDKISIYIKRKYLLKILSIYDNYKKGLLKKYIKIWKNKIYIKNQRLKYLKKFITKKDHITKGLKLSYLFKWQYHTKIDIMKNNIKIIQNEYRNYMTNKLSKNNWIKIANALSQKKYGNEINDIIKRIKAYIYLNKIKRFIMKKTGKNIFHKFKKYDKDSLFKLKMGNIINKINKRRYPSILKKYFNKWNANINKEMEREDKLNDLLYTIEKRMNINSVKFISQVSLIKNIYEYYANFRKFEYFLKLKKYSQKKKSISDFANDLSSAFDDIKLKEKKIVLSKICKYLVNIKLLKLLDKIRINRNKEVKQYKIKLIKYLKNKKAEFSSSEKRKKGFPYQYMSPNQKQKIDNSKKLDKSKTKSQSIITISNKKTRNYKEKENEKEKEIIKKKIVKGYHQNNKKGYRNNKIYEKDKYNDDKISRSESEYESENNHIKENINAIYEPLLGALNKVIKKIMIRKMKEYLIIIKKNIKIIKEEKEKERIYYIHKLYKTLRTITIKKLFFEKNELLRAKKLINLIKITGINSQISTDRWIRQIIRRWRFISFVKIMSKKKLELMYKNLHVGYLEIINSLFNNENQCPSIIKEFENFGSNIGMYKNSDILNKEKDLYQKVKKKYISKPIEYDIQNSINIESGKFINDLKYKSDEEQGEDYTDSDKGALNKIGRNRMRRSVNYDRDKP